MLAWVTGCQNNNNGSSSGGGGSTTARTYVGVAAPGDLWTSTVDLPNGTFNATNKVTGKTYKGSAQVQNNGFLKLSINSASDTTDASITTFPAVSYALELLGVGGVAPKFVIVGITTNTATNEPYQILLIQQ